jgi:hypothetical protein
LSVPSGYIRPLDAGGNVTYQGDGVSGFFVDNADFRTDADAALNIPAYQRVDTSTSYDTSGFPPYLAFNGTNSCMITPSTIDLTGTAALGVFVGALKSTDVGNGTILESSPDFSLNTGCFYLRAPSGGTAIFQFIPKGSGGTANTFSPSVAA